MSRRKIGIFGLLLLGLILVPTVFATRPTGLKALHRIRIAGQRKCRVRGSVMSVWEVVA